MITDILNGRLADIKTFAKENDLKESFNESFSSLENYSGKGDDVFLYNDIAILSLEFVIIEEGRIVLNGGFKFHGKHNG